MKKLYFLFIVFLALFSTSSTAQKSEVYGLFLKSNPESLDSSYGYCKNRDEEKKLWTGINKFASSLLFVMPQIPPEQKSYIQGEISSGNNERLVQIMNSSFYKIEEVLIQMKNIESLSSLYLKNQNKLLLKNKVEIIGRTLLNLNMDIINFGNFDEISKDLKSRKYHISSDDLHTYWAWNFLLRKALIFHLICYGEQ